MQCALKPGLFTSTGSSPEIVNFDAHDDNFVKLSPHLLNAR